MHLFLVQKIIGILLMIFSTVMLVPAIVSFVYGEQDYVMFLLSFALTFLSGTVMWFFARHQQGDMRLRDGFLIVVLFWSVLGAFGALPFYLIENYQTGHNFLIYDALFESFSGLTTTGATILTHLDGMPHALLLYRHLLQWLGGLGIVVLAIAVLPMLSIGGMQLYRAEILGPNKDSKLTPRITGTAKVLWYIYVFLTVACALAYWLAGMTPFDAICHSFSTVSIGGFSTHNESFSYFNSITIEMVASLFTVIAGANFALHFGALRHANFRSYINDSEFKLYISVLAFAVVVTSMYLWSSGEPWMNAWRHGIFQAISIATTTGFTIGNYTSWTGFLPIFLILMSFIGCCSGSTGGGIKVIRLLLLIKQGWREMVQLIHPHAVTPVVIGHRVVERSVMRSVWGFFSVYIALFALLVLALLASGVEEITAFSAVAASLNNLGAGIAGVSDNYSGLGNYDKMILCFAMLLGRLEIFSLLVILMPGFWRR